MSVPLTSLGGRALHRGDDDEVEREYDRLRDAARAEAQKRNDCFDRSRQAYENGDGARAKELSNEGKAHGAKMADYNRQASEYIFRENNAPDRVEEDCIDLHGQFVEEAERIVEARIISDRDAGRTHLHVIVGKGNHSANHVTKIKPKVEAICNQMGLKYHVEENAGRIYVNLQGGEAIPPPRPGHHQAPHHERPPAQHQQPPPQQAPAEEPVDDLVALIFGKLRSFCCAVM